MHHTTRSLRVAALGLFCTAATAHAVVTISNVDILPGGTYSYCSALNADGTAAAGYADTSGVDNAIRWTLAGGIQSLGTLPGGATSGAEGISADGLAVSGAGAFSDATSGTHGFRWTSAGLQDIGELPGGTFHQSFGHAMSGDGNTIVGNSYSSVGFRAFRWRTVGGIESLGQLPNGFNSDAHGVSADGSVVTGLADSPNGNRIFRWTSEGGMENLGVLSGGQASYGWAINADGSVIVGKSDSNIGTVAVRWTRAGGLQSLGLLSGSPYSSAHGVSADGNTIVGVSALPGFTGYHAFLWKPSIGMVDLNTYLPTLGLDLTGWTLQEGLAVSGDGSSLAGNGRYNGQQRAWVVRGLPGACTAPGISTQPDAAFTCGTGAAVFHAAATGTATLSYQWKVESPANSGTYAPLTGATFNEPATGLTFQVADATTGTLTVSAMQLGSHANRVRFVATATNSCGNATTSAAALIINSADFNNDGDVGTDSDIESYFACLGGSCCAACGSADFNGDGDIGTDADIESFFRVLAGGPC